mgnify:CR=1 FL=1
MSVCVRKGKWFQRRLEVRDKAKPASTHSLMYYTGVCCRNVWSMLLKTVLEARPCMPWSAWSVRAHGVEMSLCCTPVRVITWSATHPVHLGKKY